MISEDNEPPSKRLKGPQGVSKDYTLHKQTASTSLGDSMARPLSLQRDDETIGLKGIIKKQEFVKIINRALYSLGYSKTATILEEESGIPLRSSAVTLFMQQVVDGKWDECLSTLHNIGLTDEAIVKSASFLILEQKFLELLRKGKHMAALLTLRNEIVPLSINGVRVHELSTYIIYPSQFLALGLSDQDTDIALSRANCLEKLQKLLPAAIMIPESRLEHLVEQALDVQRDACVFHNTLNSELSLYTDHQCGRDQIPSKTLQTLQEHKDEVWFLQFSHNGKYLASSSKDQTALLWEVQDDGQLILKHTLSGHLGAVSIISWRHDDSQLLTCGTEEAVRRWDVSSGKCLHVYEKAGSGLISCGWLADGEGIVSGMSDKSICLWDLEGNMLECWKGHRTENISDMALTSDGKIIISICRGNTLLLFNRESRCERIIEEEDRITSFSLSKDNKFLLVNIVNQEIHLWRITGDPKIVSKFKGHKRTRFLVRSCFGGFEQAFIASGSEDSQVYIWHRGTGELLTKLPGHSAAVNCVSWHPMNPHMLASASDDCTIRIWGLENQKCKGTATQSNGKIHHQPNGRT
ncbi:WD repeat-containing protein 26 homolog isoform X2 [Apium graveolens]|uniref:WD repeat-containing protein 26 homolog isoform X2 n=1 Tax=Apium graveolens TaxID=4045 RepID=UPI003D79C86B